MTDAERAWLGKTEVGKAIVSNYDNNAGDDKEFAVRHLRRSIENNKDALGAPPVNAEAKPAAAMDAKSANKVLGMDAALGDAELRRKMAAWDAHRDERPGFAQKADAAKAILAYRAAKGKADARSTEVDERPKAKAAPAAKEAAENDGTPRSREGLADVLEASGEVGAEDVGRIVKSATDAEVSALFDAYDTDEVGAAAGEVLDAIARREAKAAADAEAANDGGKKDGGASSVPTDEGFAAWATGRDGRPMSFASEEERANARAMFDGLVRRGRVDGKTGRSNVRWSRSGIYTGSAADYEKPSLIHVGTGEGSQVYGWGLYGSTVRGVAEGYAAGGQSDHTVVMVDGKKWKPGKNASIGERTAYEQLDDLSNTPEDIASYCESMGGERYKEAAKFIRSHQIEIRDPHSYVYEQTFFTNRAEGDESHLLSWYEPVSEENKKRIVDELNKEKVKGGNWHSREDGIVRYIDNGTVSVYQFKTNEDLYRSLKRQVFESFHTEPEKAASEFLARADIDGVKYPVDSYGGKWVKDGDKVGWNYVSFRDDNIRVDHKWVDGKQRWSKAADESISDALNGVDKKNLSTSLEKIITDNLIEIRGTNGEKIASKISAEAFFDKYSRMKIPLSTGSVMYFAPDEKTVARYNGDRSAAWAEYALHQVTNNHTDNKGNSYRRYNSSKVEIVNTMLDRIVLEDNAEISDNGNVLFYSQIDDGHYAKVIARPTADGNYRADLTDVSSVYEKGKVPGKLNPLAAAVGMDGLGGGFTSMPTEDSISQVGDESKPPRWSVGSSRWDDATAIDLSGKGRYQFKNGRGDMYNGLSLNGKDAIEEGRFPLKAIESLFGARGKQRAFLRLVFTDRNTSRPEWHHMGKKGNEIMFSDRDTQTYPITDVTIFAVQNFKDGGDEMRAADAELVASEKIGEIIDGLRERLRKTETVKDYVRVAVPEIQKQYTELRNEMRHKYGKVSKEEWDSLRARKNELADKMYVHEERDVERTREATDEELNAAIDADPQAQEIFAAAKKEILEAFGRNKAVEKTLDMDAFNAKVYALIDDKVAHKKRWSKAAVAAATAEEEKKVVGEYGTTEDFREAGYIMPNGKMLDMSGRKVGARNADGRRTVSHYDVADVVGKRMESLLNAGWIRIQPESGGINMTRLPDMAAMETLERFVESRNGEVTVEIFSPDGYYLASGSYEPGTSVARIDGDIWRYFKEGKKLGKGLQPNGEMRWSKAVTAEDDAAYADAVARGDRATALRMIRDAADKAMPNTKVVDENGEPRIVYHQTNGKVYINRFTGEDWEKLDWKQREEWEGKSEEEWNDTWEEKDFYTFDNRSSRTTIEFPAHFFSPAYDRHHEYGTRTIAAFLNLKKPAINPNIPGGGSIDNAGSSEMERLKREGYDGFIRTDESGNVYEYGVWDSSQIKSADITYDDDGNLIPLSERFNPQKSDIRWSKAVNDNVPEEERSAFWSELNNQIATYGHFNKSKSPSEIGVFTNNAYYVCDIIDGEPVSVHGYPVDDANREYIRSFDKKYKKEIHAGARTASEWIDLVGLEDERTTGRNFIAGHGDEGQKRAELAVNGNEEADVVSEQDGSRGSDEELRGIAWSKAAEAAIPKDVREELHGITQERINYYRAKVGLPPLESKRRTLEEMGREGQGLFANRDLVNTIVDAVSKKPRALSEEETVAIDLANAELEQQYEMTMAQVDEAMLRGNKADELRLRSEADALKDRIDKFGRALRDTGSVTGRALALRRLMVSRNLTLAGFTSECEALKGKALTDEEKKDVAAAYRAVRDAIAGKDGAVLRELTKRIRDAAESDVSAIVAELKRRGAKSVPTDVDGKFKDAVKQLVAWNDVSGGILTGLQGAKETVNGIIRYHVANGVGENLTGKAKYDAVMGATLGTVKQYLGGATMEELEQAVSGYGISRPLSLDETELAVRDMDLQAKRYRALADLLNRKFPKATGDRRAPTSDEVKRLDAEIREKANELKMQAGLSPEEMQKLVDKRLATLESRLQNYRVMLMTENFKPKDRRAPRIMTPEIMEKEKEVAAAMKKVEERKKHYRAINHPLNFRVGQEGAKQRAPTEPAGAR